MSKLIHATSLDSLKRAFPDWESSTSNVFRSVGYTDDGYLYTHGKVFQMIAVGSDNPWGLAMTLSGQDLSTTVSGYTATVKLPVVGVNTTAEDDLSITSLLGVFTAKHKDKFSDIQNVGPGAISSDSISVPRLAISKTGHITAQTSYTATLNKVKQNSNNTATTAYVLFGTGAGTSETEYSTTISANLSSGTLSATNFMQNGVLISSIYAPTMHASTASTHGVGSNTLYGHLKLSDSISSSLGEGGGVAATPKAITDSLAVAKKYAEDLLGTTDAMLFVGTISGSGVIQSYNNTVITQPITIGTTNISALISYSAGWTFKVVSAGTITGIGKLEIGDMIICVNNYSTTYKASDWSAIQSNIDGAVTIDSNLVSNALVLGGTSTTIKSLANGSNGQYLIINSSGVPTWTTVSTNMRAIKINGNSFLASNIITALDLVAGSGITLGTNASTGAVTINSNGVLDTFALSISNDSTVIGSYQPKTAAATLSASGGLKASLSGTTFTVAHANSYPSKGTGLYQFSVDSYGHVSAGSEVTSLPNSAALIIANGAGTTVDSYIGNIAKTIKFGSGTDISLTTTSASNVTTITPSITHRYRPVSYQPFGNSTATVLYDNNNSGTLTLRAGDNTQITNATGVLTISSTDTNTWRNVKAIVAGTTNVAEVLGTSIGVSDLEFGSDFLWSELGDNGKLQIGWAEVDASGNITYVI